MRRAIDEAERLAKDRRQFDQAIADFQLVQALLADSETHWFAARLCALEAARALQATGKATREAAFAKYFASEALGRVADRCLQVLGGSGYDLLILDDISYVRKDQAETSVLFELIAERYECRSILITANQPFSGWDNVFPDPGMTVAAIDRLVHHSTIFELNNVESYRGKAGARQQKVQRDNDKADRRRQQSSDIDNHPQERHPCPLTNDIQLHQTGQDECRSTGLPA
jgi:hypothetical protein